ncbi:GIP [Symbiodinium microadriaticum]|nr:GIP [Symbiodinium microadriaticum]
MSAQAVTTGQSGASDQPNGVVRPQQGNGHQNAETLGVFLDAAAAPLQTAEHEEIKHEDQRREQTRDSELLGGPAGSSDRQQTAANAYDGYEMRSGEVDLAGRFSQERQTGVQIGPQGPVDEVNLAEQTVGVDPGGSIPLSGGGGIQADYHTPRQHADLTARLQLELSEEKRKACGDVHQRLVQQGALRDLRRDGGAGSLEGLGVIEALAQSMRQIQDLQVKALSKGDDDIGSPEAVKTAVTTLPTLGLPEGDQCGLVFQDWIIQITTAMQDLSTSSGTWWEGVKTIVVQAYSQWLGATPLERLGIEPTGSPELVAGKYLRINARACAMVVQAIPEEQANAQLSCKGYKEVIVLQPQRRSFSTINEWEVSVQAGDQRARNAVEPESETSPKAVASIETAQGQPLTWEAILQAAAKVAGVPPEAKAPSLHVIAIHAVGEQENENVEAYALVDSGATHPLRRASSIEEWDASSVVVVHLAGGEVVELKMNKAGTLLVPIGGSTRTTSTAPIVPLGSLVGVLGYRMEWQGSRCRLIGKEGDVLTLRVRDGCPEITEQQALSLIARIEEKKLADLRAATAVTKEKIREAAISLDKTWFDHLIA